MVYGSIYLVLKNKSKDKTPRIVDIMAGSGSLSIGMREKFKNARIVALLPSSYFSTTSDNRMVT